MEKPTQPETMDGTMQRGVIKEAIREALGPNYTRADVIRMAELLEGLRVQLRAYADRRDGRDPANCTCDLFQSTCSPDCPWHRARELRASQHAVCDETAGQHAFPDGFDTCVCGKFASIKSRN